MKVARITSIATKDGCFVWGGANWYFVAKRPNLNLDRKAQLSSLGRVCLIRSSLTDDELRQILAGFSISLAQWNNALHKVQRTSPLTLESLLK